MPNSETHICEKVESQRLKSVGSSFFLQIPGIGPGPEELRDGGEYGARLQPCVLFQMS